MGILLAAEAMVTIAKTERLHISAAILNFWNFEILINFIGYINSLSGGGGGGGLLQPPFRIFPRTIFAFLLRLPYGQFTHPLSRYPCIYAKIFQKFLLWKKLGVGLQQPPPVLRREGVAAKMNKFS